MQLCGNLHEGDRESRREDQASNQGWRSAGKTRDTLSHETNDRGRSAGSDELSSVELARRGGARDFFFHGRSKLIFAAASGVVESSLVIGIPRTRSAGHALLNRHKALALWSVPTPQRQSNPRQR